MSKTYGIPSDSLLWTCHFFLRYIFSNFGTKLWHVLSYVCPLLVKLFSQNFKGPKIHLLHSYSKPGPAEPGFRCVSPHNYYGCTFWVYIQCTRYLVEVHFSLNVPCGMRWEAVWTWGWGHNFLLLYLNHESKISKRNIFRTVYQITNHFHFRAFLA
jgi:hypothetical protein